MFAYVSSSQAVLDGCFPYSRLFIEMFRLQSICNSNFRANGASRHSGKLNHPPFLVQVVNQARLQVTKSVMSLLNYYRWNKFSIIYEEAWEKVADALSQQAKDSNKTINHKKQVVDRHKCCENDLECCRPGYWYNVNETCPIYAAKLEFSGERHKVCSDLSASPARGLHAAESNLHIFLPLRKPDHSRDDESDEDLHFPGQSRRPR